MTDQTFPSQDELRGLFNQLVESENTNSCENGTNIAIESLSYAIRDLQAIGIDTQLNLTTTHFEEVFKLTDKIRGHSAHATVTLSGILTISGQDHLLAVMTTEDSEPVLKIYLSDFNFASRHITGDYRGECFDLKNDAQAIAKLEIWVLAQAASAKFIHDHDTAQSLGRNNHTPLYKKKL